MSTTTSTSTPRESDQWTVGRLLNWTADYLKRKGSESPLLDAQILLADVLGCERVRLYTNFEDLVGPDQRARFRELVRQRGEGKPVAYLVGRKEFFSLRLEVEPAVLIPRPDTETVVVEFVTLFRSHPAPWAADVGTGSGAIALACLSQHKEARFLATDISAEALKVCERNAENLGFIDRLELHEGDLLEELSARGPFDAILSNPPYIKTGDISGLEPGVRDHEPHRALDGGEDGLQVVTRLIHQAVPLLKPGGCLILEIGSAQETPVRAALESQGQLEEIMTVKDAAGHPRVLRARKAKQSGE